MEPLQKRSDGIFETPSGSFAVVPLKITGVLGKNGEQSFFRFRGHVMSPPVEIRWRSGDAFIIIPQDTALALLQHGYAENVPDDLVARYMIELEKHSATAKDFIPPGATVTPAPAELPPGGAADFVPPAAADESKAGEFVPPGAVAPAPTSGDNRASSQAPAPSGKKGK